MTVIVCQLSDCMYNREDKRPENKAGRLCGASAIGIEKKRTHACCDTYMALPDKVLEKEKSMGDKYLLYVNAQLQCETFDEEEVWDIIKELPDTSTFAVRNENGEVVEKFKKENW